MNIRMIALVKTKINIRTINDDPTDFCKLFQIYQLATKDDDIVIDFTGCGFLRQNAVSFLGGLCRLKELNGSDVSFDWSTLSEKIYMNLAQNGFVDAMDGSASSWDGNSIPYREDLLLDSNEIVDYLKTKWLGKGWINVSRKLSNAISGNLYEIYANAFEHGDSKVGVFTCGQYYKSLHELALTVIDFGVGIPYNVREYQKKFRLGHTIRSDKALEWAFQRGTTTKADGTSRGMGLDLLKQFIKVNNGRLHLFSHDAYVFIDANDERYMNHPCHFKGTALNITLSCDERYYILDDEKGKTNLF